jgi:hypothetical protein
MIGRGERPQPVTHSIQYAARVESSWVNNAMGYPAPVRIPSRPARRAKPGEAFKLITYH